MPNKKAAAVTKVIGDSGILVSLEWYHPEVVSENLIGLDIESTEIKIICSYENQFIYFSDLRQILVAFDAFSGRQTANKVTATFEFGGFRFNIDAYSTPTHDQIGYRYFRALSRLSTLGGSPFRDQVLRLKQQGLKTETAIFQTLNLSGEPYSAILDTELLPSEKILQMLHS